MKTVAQILEIVREWVSTEAVKIPGFYGAYLAGGISQLSPEISFPEYKDIDLVVVLQPGTESKAEILEVSFRDLWLEVRLENLDGYLQPETFLANPETSPFFLQGAILADFQGQLERLQGQVKAQYARPDWLSKRCAAQKEAIHESIQALTQTHTMFEAPFILWDICSLLSGLISLASLRAPTHRNALVRFGEIMNEQGRADLHDQMLHLWGSANVTVAQAKDFLELTSRAYDRAMTMRQTPSLFDEKLNIHLRPSFAQASQEMIAEGCHREAMFMIALPFCISIMALLNDGEENVQPWALSLWNQFWQEHGFRSLEQAHYRAQKAQKLSQELFRLADEIAERFSK